MSPPTTLNLGGYTPRVRSRAPARVVLLSRPEVSSRTPFKNFIYNDNIKFCGARANFPLRAKSARAWGLVSGGRSPGTPKTPQKYFEKGKMDKICIEAATLDVLGRLEA